MWPKKYKDYPTDTPLKKECVSPSHGIIGCEMHEISGWGESLHLPNAKKKSYINQIKKARNENQI